MLLFLAALSALAADFARDVEPVLRARCQGCHGAQVQSNGLRLDNREDARKGGYSGAAIQPGSAQASKLIQMIAAGKMPPGAPLPPAELAVLREWIDSGADWPATTRLSHTRPKPWSFAPLRRPAIPGGTSPNPIDRFVLARLAQEKIAPAPEASKATLLRRLHLDLTGLPPSETEAAAFLSDRDPAAYERLVDRLLESPHFGEKWARHWLDLARYADSEGGVQDYPRPFAWRYRDWVVQAFNRDMPFDRFTIEQVAGDLLPNATLDQKIAAGFHRQTVTSREGGIDLEKLRYDQLIDRANTVGTVWLASSVGCAQCHDHKYDPISQKDYYSLYAFFENARELDLEAPLAGELGVYRGYIQTYLNERRKLWDEYKAAPLEAEWETNTRDAAANPGQRPHWDVTFDSFSKLVDNGPRILHTPVGRRTRREQEAIENHFAKSAAAGFGKKRFDELKLKELSDKLQALNEKYPALSIVMTLAEEDRRRPTHIRLRGSFEDLGIEVSPAVPQSLPPLDPARTPDRLALAQWLVAKENPLTARVTVNRLWQELFGKGLVRTSEDFGMQGERPTHPELLDWLAAEFRDNGWSMKKTIRLLVTSSTYRQSSKPRPDLEGKDPANNLLARQTRLRLPAELIRDSALIAAGLLMDEVGGESIRPPQPEGVADLQYSMKWEETQGRKRYRRGLYIHTQRTAAYPLLMNFDAPDRLVSCARRESSNTPLQPLNLMNDPVFVEAAQALAYRVLRQPAAARLEFLYRIGYQREPSPRERDTMLSYLERRRELARHNPKAAEAMPLGDLAGIDQAEASAWFGASRALLNSDEFLTRE